MTGSCSRMVGFPSRSASKAQGRCNIPWGYQLVIGKEPGSNTAGITYNFRTNPYRSLARGSQIKRLRFGFRQSKFDGAAALIIDLNVRDALLTRLFNPPEARDNERGQVESHRGQGRSLIDLASGS